MTHSRTSHRMVEILKNEINIVPFKQMPALNLHPPPQPTLKKIQMS